MTYSFTEVMVMVCIVSAVCTIFGFVVCKKMIFDKAIKELKSKTYEMHTCDLVWNEKEKRFACSKCGHVERGIEDERIFDPLFWKYCPNCGLEIRLKGDENDDATGQQIQ